MKPIFLLISCILLLATLSKALEDTKPAMVVQIFRHGARAPSSLKYDPSWQYPGELTATGMRQHYILGSIISQVYPHLLTRYSPVDIFIRSSNMNRTIMSASSHLYGVFQTKGPSLPPELNNDLTLPPYDDQELVADIASELYSSPESIPNGYQPLVIQVEKTPEDNMIFVGPWSCPKLNVWQAERDNDSLNREIFDYLQNTITSLNKLGHNVKTLYDLHNFGDTLIDNHYDNRTLPKGIEYGSTVFNDSVFAFKWYSAHNYVGYGLERALKTLAILDQIIEWFDGIAKGTKSLKFAFLSAHDTTLLPLLGLYNITTPHCLYENYKSEKLGNKQPYPECVYPMFASQIIYEFYNRTDGPYVRFLYNGKPLKICSKSEGYDCKLTDFAAESRQLMFGHTIKDFPSLCAIETSTPNDGKDIDNNGTSFWIVALIVIMAIAIGVLGHLLVLEKRQKVEESNGFYKGMEAMDVKKDTELKELVVSNRSTSKGL